MSDQGTYKLVAKSESGETQSQAVQLQEEQVNTPPFLLNQFYFVDHFEYWFNLRITVQHKHMCVHRKKNG